MSLKIIPKNRYSTGLPDPSVLSTGELWINTADKKIGVKDQSDGIVVLSDLTASLAQAQWGSISGSIESQSDLQQALNEKANLSSANFTGAVTVNSDPVLTQSVANSTYIAQSNDLTFTNVTVTGSLTANASSASKLSTAQTISATGDATWSVSFDGSQPSTAVLTLSSTGVSQGAYGQSQSAAVNYGESFTVPYVTVDEKGRVTEAQNISVTLPAAPTSITGNAGTATKLQTAQNITLSGDATGSASFDGSQPTTISVTVNNAAHSEQTDNLSTSRAIDGVNFNGSASISHYGVSADAADTVAKTLALDSYVLAVGSMAIVTFTNGNSAANPTLDIASTGAKPIINAGQALSGVAAGSTMMVVYDGTNYQVVGGVGGLDLSQYYTKEEMDAKFLSAVQPVAQGTMNIYTSDQPQAEPIVQAYNEAKASSAGSIINAYTKEEADALFATVVDPVIVAELTINKE